MGSIKFLRCTLTPLKTASKAAYAGTYDAPSLSSTSTVCAIQDTAVKNPVHAPVLHNFFAHDQGLYVAPLTSSRPPSHP